MVHLATSIVFVYLYALSLNAECAYALNSSVYQGSTSVLTQENVTSSDLDLSMQRVNCVNASTGENCTDKGNVNVTKNNGQSDAIGSSDMQQLEQLPITTGNNMTQDLVANDTPICINSSEIRFSKIYQDSSSVLLEINAVCSKLDLSKQSVKCFKVNTGENCIDKTEIYANSGQSAIILLRDLRPGQVYNVTIAAGSFRNQDLVPKYTLISMDSAELRISTIYKDSSSVLLQANVNSSDPTVSFQGVRCFNVNTRENCIDNVEVYSNSGQSAIISLSNLRQGHVYNVTIAAGSLRNQDLLANYTLIFLDSSELRISTIYQDSNFVLLQANVTSSDPDLSVLKVSCVNVKIRENCSDNVEVYSTDNNGKSVTISLSHLQPEELYSVTFAAGNKKVEDLVSNNTLVCTDPSKNIDWFSQSQIDGTNLKLPVYADNYEITLVPTFCIHNKTLVHSHGAAPTIYNMEKGCEYRVYYAARCKLPTGGILNSQFVSYNESFCTEPELPTVFSSLADFKITETTLEINGFGVPSGQYSYIAFKPLNQANCGKPIIGNLTRGETDLKRKDLVPGCDYHLRYSAVCRADTGSVESAINYLDICTIPREIDVSTVSNTAYFNSIRITGHYDVKAVEGYVYRFKVKSVTPNGIYDVNPPQKSENNLYVSQLSPATKYEFELVNQNWCNEESKLSVKYTVCTLPAAPNKSSIQVESDLRSLTIKGTASNVQAITGPLDAYRITYFNSRYYSDDTFEADKNADLELSGLESGTKYEIQLKTVVEPVEDCGIQVSSEQTYLQVCTKVAGVLDSLTLSDSTATSLTISGFGVTSGNFRRLNITLRGSCADDKSTHHKIYTDYYDYDDSKSHTVKFHYLEAACHYYVSYYATCEADNKEYSTRSVETVFTTARESPLFAVEPVASKYIGEDIYQYPINEDDNEGKFNHWLLVVVGIGVPVVVVVIFLFVGREIKASRSKASSRQNPPGIRVDFSAASKSVDIEVGNKQNSVDFNATTLPPAEYSSEQTTDDREELIPEDVQINGKPSEQSPPSTRPLTDQVNYPPSPHRPKIVLGLTRLRDFLVESVVVLFSFSVCDPFRVKLPPKELQALVQVVIDQIFVYCISKLEELKMRTRIDTRNYERHERSYGPDLTESRNSSWYEIYQRMVGCTFGLEDPVLAMFTVALLNAMGRKDCVVHTTEVVSKLAIGESESRDLQSRTKALELCVSREPVALLQASQPEASSRNTKPDSSDKNLASQSEETF
ncbi:uncharacterized protein LOC134838970 [Symsagittifera roscoffensis]|uniref:uncharacterized protein LOC134838970 n=1 Tax=Symsagittifera roscoffensis TaxID=84072 RepID=UPI00307B8D35